MRYTISTPWSAKSTFNGVVPFVSLSGLSNGIAFQRAIVSADITVRTVVSDKRYNGSVHLALRLRLRVGDEYTFGRRIWCNQERWLMRMMCEGIGCGICESCLSLAPPCHCWMPGGCRGGTCPKRQPPTLWRSPF